MEYIKDALTFISPAFLQARIHYFPCSTHLKHSTVRSENPLNPIFLASACTNKILCFLTQSDIKMLHLFQMAGQDPKWQKDAADQNFDYMFKLLIIGNSSVGKTSFLFRYADDSFTSAFVSTVGIDFKVKTVFRHDKRVKLQIWVRRI
jgi:hypothetical protein